MRVVFGDLSQLALRDEACEGQRRIEHARLQARVDRPRIILNTDRAGFSEPDRIRSCQAHLEAL